MKQTDYESSTIIKPKWLTTLFRLFVANYKTQWTKFLNTPELERANDYLWIASLEGIPEHIILHAGMLAVKQHTFPPSIQQFLEITTSLQRNERMEGSTQNVLKSGTGKYHRDPPSPLLQEYMAKNPPKDNDPFKAIFAKYSGQELGTEVLKEIKRQLGGKKIVSY
jgi:hypothetical protein